MLGGAAPTLLRTGAVAEHGPAAASAVGSAAAAADGSAAPRATRELPGIPPSGAARESLLKEINQRGKGTEKFWCEAGAEPIRQRRADFLSHDQAREACWPRRQARETG